MSHTPGPWIAAAAPSSIVGWPVVTPSGRSICSVNYVAYSKIDPKVPGDVAFNRESAANAALIAAAPDLLEALKHCAAVVAGETMHRGGLIVALEKARAAIAKATSPST